jgi:hypothetical protein
MSANTCLANNERYGVRTQLALMSARVRASNIDMMSMQMFFSP